MFNLFLIEGNSTLVAVLVSIGVVLLVAVVVSFIVMMLKKNNKSEKDVKKENKVEAPAKPVKTPEEIQKEKEERLQRREENKKNEATSKIRRTSELGIERSPECFIKEDPNGIEAVGIIFNKNSKTYMFGPKGNKLNIGDVVIVKDLSGNDRMVPIVVPNRMVNENDLVKPFKDIESVVYQTEKHVEYTATEPVEEPVQEVVEETPKFTVTFDTLGHAEAPEALTDLEFVPEELPLVSAEGFEFNGWTLNKDSDELVELGSKLDGDVTLYAIWEEVKVEEPAEEPVQEEAEDADDKEDEAEEKETEVVYNAETHTYTVIRRKKSFEGRLCVTSDDNKKFYNQVKNKLMSYGLTNRISKTSEKFRLKRELLAQIKFTAKQMVIYLALDPKQFENTKYKGKDMSEKKSYQSVPFQYRTKTERKTMWMLELIDLLAKEHNLVKNEKFNEQDFTKDYPFMDDEKLIEKGYLVVTEKTVTEVVEEPEEENEE